MAPITVKRRSSRQMASRKRSRYIDPETDDELMTPSDDDSDAELPRELNDSPRPAKRPRTQPRHRPETRSKRSAKDKARQARSKRRKVKTKVIVIGRPKKPRSETKNDSGHFTGPSDGVIPPWSTLPVEVLKDIFIFGSQPLTAASVTWLLGAARTCRAFAAPALEALYYWPAMWSPMHLHRFLALLQKREGRLINYNTKVKRLDIDMRRLAYTAHNRPLFDLGELIAELARLQHLEIIHPMDEPPYRGIKLLQWHYQPSIFRALETAQIRLTAWRWTKSMIDKPPEEMFEWMSLIHESPAFQTIRELVLCGFDASSYAPPPQDEQEERKPTLWTALSKLPQLKDISFVTCVAAQLRELTNLPPGLERLELSNCQHLTSDVLAHYLNVGGSQLKELVLNHNPALDLAFLPGMRANCPKLESLEMLLHFYSEYEVINDAEPLYDDLLEADEIPTWPSTMREIDIQGMQKWSAAGAVNLFKSLVDSAPQLPNLRYIVLHSHINIPWRDRAGFRDRWVDEFQRVFKRPDRPPNQFNGSKRQFRLWKQKREGPVKAVEVVKAPPLAAGPSQRRSQRVAIAIATPSPTPAPTDVVASSVSDTESAMSDTAFRQGRCDVVDIRIDNQRPRETQFTEQDFLDSEASGDEDWNENAEGAPVEDGYAW